MLAMKIFSFCCENVFKWKKRMFSSTQIVCSHLLFNYRGTERQKQRGQQDCCPHDFPVVVADLHETKTVAIPTWLGSEVICEATES